MHEHGKLCRRVLNGCVAQSLDTPSVLTEGGRAYQLHFVKFASPCELLMLSMYRDPLLNCDEPLFLQRIFFY